MAWLSLGEIPEQIIDCTQYVTSILQSKACLDQSEACSICITVLLGGIKKTCLASTAPEIIHEPSAGYCPYAPGAG